MKDSLTREATKDLKITNDNNKKTKKDIELEKKKKELDDALIMLKKEKEAFNNKQQKIPLDKSFPKQIKVEQVEKL
jgi:hypothetical protein